MTSGRRSSVTPSSPPTPVVHGVFGSSVAVADLFDLQPSICAIVSSINRYSSLLFGYSVMCLNFESAFDLCHCIEY
ncbi:unnamed protein product [Arabidopsis lyrata]|uniref:Predicted protein n=1 Tax=Arabidopsis lyrata subsp. lyrata TaxID=81972 RepID=D7KLS3_ARALL|nr:predicted protein [Arabidopsis lyrata subsp. lyrata]CAH8253216.1 unnamed protein product [Arabidopsis lyrata]